MGKKGLTPPNFVDLTNCRFGRLLVVKKSNIKTSNTTKWECVCDCGKTIITDRTNLIKGRSKSCGCLAKELRVKRSKKYNKYMFRGDSVIGITNNTNKIFLVDKEDYFKIKEYCWVETKNNYLEARDSNQKKNIFLHNLILGFPKEVTDHINRNKADNRKSNLRLVTHQQNCINKSIQSNNKSGIAGVYFDKNRGKWVASLTYKGKKYFKRFNEKRIAIKERKKLEEKYFKEYAPI